MLVSMLLTWLLPGAIVVVILMTPALLEKLHGVPPTQALVANNLATLRLTVGVVLAGLLVGVIGGVPFVMVRAFPAAIRFSGLSFSYNVSYAVFGGLTPVVVPLLLAADPLAHLHCMLALCVLGCLVGLWLMRREGPIDAHRIIRTGIRQDRTIAVVVLPMIRLRMREWP